MVLLLESKSRFLWLVWRLEVLLSEGAGSRTRGGGGRRKSKRRVVVDDELRRNAVVKDGKFEEKEEVKGVKE